MLDFSSRFSGTGDLLDVTSKPLIFDADNGGRIEHLPYSIKTLERLEFHQLWLKIKLVLKKFLFSDQSGSKQDSIVRFCKKLNL